MLAGNIKGFRKLQLVKLRLHNYILMYIYIIISQCVGRSIKRQADIRYHRLITVISPCPEALYSLK